MSAIPSIPDEVRALAELDRWVDREAPKADTMAKRMRFTVAVMDRAALIGQRQRANDGAIHYPRSGEIAAADFLKGAD